MNYLLNGLPYVLSLIYPLIPFVCYELFGIYWGILGFLVIAYIGGRMIGNSFKKPSIKAEDIPHWIGLIYRILVRFHIVTFGISWFMMLGMVENAKGIDLVFLLLSMSYISLLASGHLHEMTHSLLTIDSYIGKMYEVMIVYGHYSKEHIYHHYDLGGMDLGYVARKNESVYKFVMRMSWNGIKYAFFHADRLLKDENKSNFYNPIFWNYISILLVCFTIQWYFGWIGVLLYVSQGIICLMLLYVMRYIRHYGLSKDRLAAVDSSIVWETSNTVEQFIVLHANHYAEHYKNPYRPFYMNWVSEDSPKLRGGFSVMLVSCLFTKSWVERMDRRLARYMKSHKSSSVAMSHF